MDEHGKKTEVMIVPNVYRNRETGMPMPVSSLTIWADEGMKEVISAVRGVTRVHSESATEYHVYIDARYDADFVGKEIEAAILCHSK